MNKWIDGWMDESINDQIYKLINKSEFCLKYCNTDDCISLKYHYKSAFQMHIFKLLTNQMSNISYNIHINRRNASFSLLDIIKGTNSRA